MTDSLAAVLRRFLPAPLAFSLCAGLLPAAGCHRNDPDQIALVQALAKDMRRPKAAKLTAACAHAVPELRDEMNCDLLFVPLMHYAPAFAGSQVARRGPSSLLGGLFGKPALVPVHYTSGAESGNLDVLMRRTGAAWNVIAVLPVK